MIRVLENKYVYYLLQFTWGLLPNLTGFFTLLFYRGRRAERRKFRNAFVFRWKRRESMATGCLIFLGEGTAMPGPWQERILTHEYGHTIQSIILGPLFLFFIAIPSSVWCRSERLKKYRERTGTSYYSLYTEAWADSLGERCVRENG